MGSSFASPLREVWFILLRGVEARFGEQMLCQHSTPKSWDSGSINNRAGVPLFFSDNSWLTRNLILDLLQPGMPSPFARPVSVWPQAGGDVKIIW